MVTEPEDIPVTTPTADTVATDAALLVHVPPDVASVSVIGVPIQTVDEPEMAAAA